MAIHFPTVPWAIGANIYEVNVRQYTKEGTFNAFATHLPRLQQMGVKILWFMPVTPISVHLRQGSLGSYYACSSYTAINTEFGTLSDFKNLVQQAHQMGFKVIIDWVANHTGADHEWTQTNNEFYVKDAQGNFTERNGWKDVIDLNYNNAALRTAMIAAMQFWIKECDIDGFRCDMAHLVPLDFWQQARINCDSLKPLFWLGECEVMEYHTVFDVTYAWEWMHSTEKIFKDECSIQPMMNVLHQYSQYPPNTQKLFFTSNHDENSWNGTEYEKYGNAAKALAVFTCTWQGMPLVYSGQENPNTKRLLFFDKDEISWHQQPLLQHFYTKLLYVHSLPAITKGETFILPVNKEGVLAFLRKYEENVVLVILNFSKTSKITITVNHPWLTGTFKSLFSSLHYVFNNTENFELQSGDYLVYIK